MVRAHLASDFSHSYVCVCVCVCACMHACACARVWVCACTCVCPHACACMCACVCVCARALALLYIVECPFMVHLGDRLLIPSVKNNPKSWLCHNRTENYCCGYWNFVFTAELNVVEFFLSQFSLILLYVQWNLNILVKKKQKKKVWLIKWKNLWKGIVFFFFENVATYVCWIFVIFSSLNTFSLVSFCSSIFVSNLS